MKYKSVENSKYKNTGVIFELLVRQVTADTLAGHPISEALNIMNKYFNASTELGKELQLYRAFFEGQKLTEARAIHFIDLILEQRQRLDEKKLAQEKYNLIKEIKEHYDLKNFLSAKIPEYVIHASIYKTFMTEVNRDSSLKIMNIADIAKARFTLVEHLAGRSQKRAIQKSTALVEEFRQQSEDLRLLTYKLLIEKFNEKYQNLSDKQKTLLREYINNVPSTNSLYEYVKQELPTLKSELLRRTKQTKDQVLQIKLHEVASQLDTIGDKRIVKDNEVTALMIAYEIVKEIS